MKKPTLYILCGLPASGKSTWREVNANALNRVVSSDDYIEAVANQTGQTYDDIFSETIKEADAYCKSQFHEGIAARDNIVVDRTNLNVKARRYWIEAAKKAGYVVQAIWFAVPESETHLDEWERRLDSRPGKTIPHLVLRTMRKSAMEPSNDEGIDSIVFLNSFGN